MDDSVGSPQGVVDGAGSVDRRVVLEARGIVKRYKRRRVLNGVDLVVREGEVAAIVGSNGAGKSTMLKICAGLLSPDKGRVMVAGSLGYCPQNAGVMGFLTPEEHFSLFGTGRGLNFEEADRRGRKLAGELDWEISGKVLVKDLSGGVRQKLNVVLSALGDPDLLLLDEPYQGFDHGSYVDFWRSVWSWREAGKAVVVVTHMLNQLDQVDRVLDLTPEKGRRHQ
ncbi:ABC transporter ATP-binding protein [Streptomyces calidiresistens]|uniref:ATP-binding cassette domain-containing protein n=1 Tax=Streptomyces calidiresistens TaxID=1485586 RepID=A0A7W3SZM8_9ACTN|nr:ABC transporter ATP-binding protein [Streptomyces calidiresistens]MBB0228225.1 ATP-binding cassette domain-containing protein [Streptomyces calidiresistens]